jgi:hypothetical protein
VRAQHDPTAQGLSLVRVLNYHRKVLLFWLALAVAIAGLVAGLAYAAVHGLRAWRSLKATGSRISGQLDQVAEATTKIEKHLDLASASSARLSTAVEQLARSRARLDVLRAALNEARATIARAVPFLPPR